MEIGISVSDAAQRRRHIDACKQPHPPGALDVAVLVAALQGLRT